MNQKSINKLTALGMMCALVFVSNYLRITMPMMPLVMKVIQHSAA